MLVRMTDRGIVVDAASVDAASPGRSVDADTPPEDVAAAGLPSAEPLVIRFASAGDGRGFTLARLLRTRWSYTGALRASGAIQVDQLFFLRRCGFDEFELPAQVDAETVRASLLRFQAAYQPVVNDPAVLRDWSSGGPE